MNEWIYGRNPIYEVLQAGRRNVFQLLLAQGVQEKGQLEQVVKLCRQRNVSVEYVPRKRLDKISKGHQGVALEASGYEYRDIDEMFELAKKRVQSPFFLILDTLQDPQNLGTLLRTAEAVGVHGVLLPLRQAASVTPSVVASSSGASEHLLVGQANLAQAIEILKQNDVWVVGLDGGETSQLPHEINLKGAIAVVVGNEGQGMRKLVRESCDFLLRLPMQGNIESLNAATAGSVALYLAWQARDYQA
jgi:23S rRNA (guanosine2251-2'-O)-methyltransferase